MFIRSRAPILVWLAFSVLPTLPSCMTWDDSCASSHSLEQASQPQASRLSEETLILGRHYWASTLCNAFMRRYWPVTK
jgi:hypothetical protein